jgi:hypothetical protein
MQSHACQEAALAGLDLRCQAAAICWLPAGQTSQRRFAYAVTGWSRQIDMSHS